MGDPLGIGPEVIVKALADLEIRGAANFVIYGCNEILTLTADRIGERPTWSRIPHDSERLRRPIKDEIVVRDYDQPESLRACEIPAQAMRQINKRAHSSSGASWGSPAPADVMDPNGLSSCFICGCPS